MAQENESTSSVTRRNVIKGGVAAGAAVWTAPLVTSFTAPASAAGSVTNTGCSECGIGGDTCGGQVPCGSGGVDGCFCSARSDGSGCVCAQSIFCGTTQACQTDADCATYDPNAVCLLSCCAEPQCFLPCDAATDRRMAATTVPDGAKLSSPSR